eukprot:8265259-Pyramimonas_sp.AAC.1
MRNAGTVSSKRGPKNTGWLGKTVVRSQRGLEEGTSADRAEEDDNNSQGRARMRRRRKHGGKDAGTPC